MSIVDAGVVQLVVTPAFQAGYVGSIPIHPLFATLFRVCRKGSMNYVIRKSKDDVILVDGEPILILTEGTAKVDNRKYKDLFHVKAKMIPFGEVEEYIGHAPGGVCPFGIKEGITVYLDESLKRFETVYPAAGNDHSAVRLTIAELEDVAGACGWIDVCKEILL